LENILGGSYPKFYNFTKRFDYSYIIRVCYGTNYQPEEDEISMGRVSTIVAPSFEERGLMREYYNT
jgi:hypothetical protein